MKKYEVIVDVVESHVLTIEAKDQYEAEELAEKETERLYGEPGPWYPRADGYTLEIESVVPAKTYPQCPPRKFIPGYDD